MWAQKRLDNATMPGSSWGCLRGVFDCCRYSQASPCCAFFQNMRCEAPLPHTSKMAPDPRCQAYYLELLAHLHGPRLRRPPTAREAAPKYVDVLYIAIKLGCLPEKMGPNFPVGNFLAGNPTPEETSTAVQFMNRNFARHSIDIEKRLSWRSFVGREAAKWWFVLGTFLE